MQKKVLLIMNCYEREYLIAKMIKDELMKMKFVECRVMYWNRGILENDIYKFMPNVVMVFPPTILPLINLMARIKVICKSQIVSFVTEGYVNEDAIDEGGWGGYYGFPSELIDYWCVWGEAYKEQLWKALGRKNRIKDEERIKVFGYPMWEQSHLRQIKEKSSLEREILEKIDIFPKTILILSGFAEANKDREEVLKSIDAYDETADEAEKERQIEKLLGIVKKTREYRDEYYALAVAMIEKYPDYLFLIKLHPKEMEGNQVHKKYDFSGFSKYKNVKVLMEENSLGEYINKVDVVINYGSTAAWEAYICQVPVIRINIDDEELSGSYGTYGPGESFRFNEREDILKYIGNIPKIKYKKEYDEYLLKWFNYDREKPYAPSRDLAQFLYDSCKPVEYDINNLIPYTRNNIAFKIRIVIAGVMDILNADFKAGVKKLKLIFKLIKFSGFSLR